LNFKHAVLALAVATLAATPALAADKRSSISIFGNVTIPEEGDNSGNIFISYGYLLTDSIELEGGVGQFFSSGITSTSLNVGAKYYFGTVGAAGRMVPYARVSVGTSRNSGGGGNFSNFGGGGGLEFTMTESASAFVEGIYQQVRVSGFDSSAVVAQFGLKLRF
jgi:hypothetical protein